MVCFTKKCAQTYDSSGKAKFESSGGPCFRGESLPAAYYALLPDLGKKFFFAIRDGSRNFVIRFGHTSGQFVFYHTPGQHPPYITSRCVKTVTLGWVGAPNERTPFRLHDAVVGFVDRSLSRTRNLDASNCTSAGVLLEPILAQHRPHNFFSGFSKVWNFRFEESCP